MKHSMYLPLLAITALVLSVACQRPQAGQDSISNSDEDVVRRDTAASAGGTSAITWRIIDAGNGTFGYDILRDGILYIHQVNIPGQPGNLGCRTPEEAEKLAAYVAGKIERGEMPPTITQDELRELGILN